MLSYLMKRWCKNLEYMSLLLVNNIKVINKEKLINEYFALVSYISKYWCSALLIYQDYVINAI